MSIEPIVSHAPVLQASKVPGMPLALHTSTTPGMLTTQSMPSTPAIPESSATVQSSPPDPNTSRTTLTFPHSSPPSYNSVAPSSSLNLAHFGFLEQASSLLVHNGFAIEVCEHIHVALQLESQYWVPSFVRAGIHLSVALELQDIFKNNMILRELNDELACRVVTTESPVGDEHDGNTTSDDFFDLTLDSDE